MPAISRTTASAINTVNHIPCARTLQGALIGGQMSEQAQEFRKMAAECEHQASLANLPSNRRTYLELALRWHEMAEQAEMLERKRHAIESEQ